MCGMPTRRVELEKTLLSFAFPVTSLGMKQLRQDGSSDFINHQQFSIRFLHSLPSPSFSPSHAPRLLRRAHRHSFLHQSFLFRSRDPGRIPIWLPEGSRCEFGRLALIVRTYLSFRLTSRIVRDARCYRRLTWWDVCSPVVCCRGSCSR